MPRPANAPIGPSAPNIAPPIPAPAPDNALPPAVVATFAPILPRLAKPIPPSPNASEAAAVPNVPRLDVPRPLANAPLTPAFAPFDNALTPTPAPVVAGATAFIDVGALELKSAANDVEPLSNAGVVIDLYGDAPSAIVSVNVPRTGLLPKPSISLFCK